MLSTGFWLFIAVQIVFFLLTLGFLSVIGYVLWSFRKEVPFVPTPRGVVRRMVTAVPFSAGMKVVDVGSGEGRIVRAVARRHPVTVMGVDDSPVLIGVSRFLSALGRIRGPYQGRMLFQRSNFRDVSLRDTNVVLCFLTDTVMASLAEKFTTELPAGSHLVSYIFSLPQSASFQEQSVTQVGKRPREKLYVYEKVA